MIYYKSTRGDKKQYTFSEAILKGIAPDGGLFVPTRIPKLSLQDLKSLVGKSYQEVCSYIINLFETDFDGELLKKIINKSYSSNFDNPQIAPLVHLKDNQYVLELWHGPTSAFKDMALSLTTYLFEESLRKEKTERKYLVVVATSGDTGKAALEAYRDKNQVSIIVFYPHNGVSKLQELSMTTQEGQNVSVYGMSGNFDDVQKSVKETLNDKVFNEKLLKEKNIVLSSANSINWGRLFPQIVYHVASYLNLVSKKVIKLGDKIDIAVPTGNFGNILSGYYAKMMGLPIRKLICATNENNVYTQFLQIGEYDIVTRKLIKTPSPAMNILIGSNLERLLYALTNNSAKVRSWMEKLSEEKYFKVDDDVLKKLKDHFFADWVSNGDCLKTIKKTYDETGYLMDPHTAVAQTVSDRYKKRYGSDVPVVICSTAHWAKFPKDVYHALTGKSSEEDEFEILEKITQSVAGAKIPQNIKELQNKKIRHTGKCVTGKEAVEEIILRYLS